MLLRFANDSVNVSMGPTEERTLLTGKHHVADIRCCNCDEVLGWKYVSAPMLLSVTVWFVDCAEPSRTAPRFRLPCIAH